MGSPFPTFFFPTVVCILTLGFCTIIRARNLYLGCRIYQKGCKQKSDSSLFYCHLFFPSYSLSLSPSLFCSSSFFLFLSFFFRPSGGLHVFRVVLSTFLCNDVIFVSSLCQDPDECDVRWSVQQGSYLTFIFSKSYIHFVFSSWMSFFGVFGELAA